MSMYIRLKRKNQTLFLHVEPHQSFAQIKSRIGETFKIETDKILLFAQDKVILYYFIYHFDAIFDDFFLKCKLQKKELVDLATISDQEIKNDDVVYMVFAKENGSGFEDINAEVFAPLTSE